MIAFYCLHNGFLIDFYNGSIYNKKYSERKLFCLKPSRRDDMLKIVRIYILNPTQYINNLSLDKEIK